MCALGYQGKGYNEAFTRNMTAIIVDKLRAPGGGRHLITVTTLSDSFCAPCPHKRGSTCENAEKIDRLDVRHGTALKLRHGDQITWSQAKSRILENISPGSLNEVCKGCQWLTLGYCDAALSRLHNSS